MSTYPAWASTWDIRIWIFCLSATAIIWLVQRGVRWSRRGGRLRTRHRPRTERAWGCGLSVAVGGGGTLCVWKGTAWQPVEGVRALVSSTEQVFKTVQEKENSIPAFCSAPRKEEAPDSKKATSWEGTVWLFVWGEHPAQGCTLRRLRKHSACDAMAHWATQHPSSPSLPRARWLLCSSADSDFQEVSRVRPSSRD
jgi:hypothetical protein